MTYFFVELPYLVLDKTLPNLSWFLSQLTKMSPLVTVSKTLDSPGGMQLSAQIHKRTSGLFSFTYKEMSCVS